MERPEKRQRSAAAPTEEHQSHSSSHTSSSCWEDAVAWIQSNGGTVHPALTFSSDRSVQTQAQTKHGGKENSAIPSGTVLMRIPSSCLLTVDTVSTIPFGKKLVDMIQGISSDTLQNDKSDLILALYLAHISSTNDIHSDHATYLATLPPPSSYNNIPRRWDDTQLESLLGGTSLLTRVRKDQSNLKSDYEAISSAWNEKDGKNESIAKLSSFEQFDDMFAAVSSRGFAGLGSDDGQSDAMVPLLDLLDHRRGTDAKKDVRYSRCSAKQGSGANSCIEVIADHDLPPGSTLHDTYGAKGNAQLLNRYGFCIGNNLEPDGSSNDVVEMSLKAGQPPVELRAGPKSYTYGKLVRMVGMFQDQDGGDEGANEQEQDSGEDDMEAFLNQCDEEEAGDGNDSNDDFEMMMYGGDDEMNDHEEEGDQEDEEKMLESECKALQEVSSALSEARQRYSLKDEKLQDALQKTDNSPEHFAAVLVQSEQRTIQLYQLAANKIHCRLESMMSGNSTTESFNEKRDSADDLLLKQVDELVSAYATIRHGGLM